jgi:hypothetical protein
MPDRITDGCLFNRFNIVVIINAGKRIARSKIIYTSNEDMLLSFKIVVSIKYGSSPLSIISAEIIKKQEIIILG